MFTLRNLSLLMLMMAVLVACGGGDLSPEEAIQGTNLYGLDYADFPENSAIINDVNVTCQVQEERGTIKSFTLIFLEQTATVIDEFGRQIVFEKEAPMTYVRSNTDSDLSRLTISSDGYSLSTEMNGKPCVVYTYTLIDQDVLAAR